MREIKFNIVYGIVSQVDTYFTKTFTLGEIEAGDHFCEISDSPLLRDYSILAKRQWTGLRDKNQVEIYEGDIVERDNSYRRENREVFWSKGAARFCTKLKGRHLWDQDKLHNVKSGNPIVIGNIHENPELLDK